MSSGNIAKQAGDVEAADHDLDPGGAQRPRDVEGARILVGLHADQTDEAEIPVRRNPR